MALHGAPGQPRDGAPLVIPVFYDSPEVVARAGATEQHWEGRLAEPPTSADAVPEDRRRWVQPARWARNVANAERRLQNVRLGTAAKDDQLQASRRVVAAALQAARVPLALPDMFGYEEQEARLVAELAVPDPERLGLWLHGMGEPAGWAWRACLLFPAADLSLAPALARCHISRRAA